MSNIGLQVRQAVPSIDPVVADYAVGYIQHVSHATEDSVSSQQIQIDEEMEFVKELLLDAGGSKEKVSHLTEVLCEQLSKKLEKNMARLEVTGDTSKRLLDINLLKQTNSKRDINSSLALLGASNDIEHTGRNMESRVDKTKLEKQERKIAKKVAKRNNKFVQYEASKLLNQKKDDDYDSFFLEINPLDFGSSAGKSKDIKIDNFDLYVGDGQRILSEASLTLAYGRRYGLVGQNGIGKSTLLRALSRRELNIPKHITILHVEQEIRGDDTPALQSVLDADVWRKSLLQEEQKINERVNELERLRAEFEEESNEVRKLDNEREDLEAHLQEVSEKLYEMESDKAESRAAAILYGLGFTKETQNLPTKQFSGGWRMRLSLARALFCVPDLLLLDEPSNMLDVPSITFLANYLQGYQSTVLVVSHDRSFLNEVATDIIHQHSERLDYYRGSNFDSFHSTREERIKNQRREYENQMAYRKHLQEFIDKFRYNAAKSSEAQSRIKKLEKLPVLEAPEDEKEVTFKFPDPEKLSPPILQMHDVTFGYEPSKVLINHVDLDVQMDSRIAFCGGNGTGKTTLLKLLMEQLTPLDGFISRNGRLRIGYFAQHHVDAMDLNLSAVSWMSQTFPGKTDEEYRRHLGAFGITGTLGLQKMQLLSGGQKSRVAFAALCLAQPHILILDEPSNHLDTQGLDALADALINFQGGVLMVSHDVAIIDRVCNEIWVSEENTVKRFPGNIHDYKKHILASADVAGVVRKH
ncbi:ATP-binding cassette (ABC) family, regulator of translational elongation [Scheffersomyces stipitis CBS 6054]|uniref:ATP-binding cassette (ABC) family, regulator of translational elongation n=1 Tax=Scheffersomyces stipitis (strain ATCC 58785 / CBS 6054 / NBRC 10063 / NRRL Y-11545) TaxID=322104 RepID=A3GFD8_PICST|nr:ATP-binding cassette (ABC) family, regulator of translational elongation [Scheffersomyces stipitis CBS 6054]EAZ63331.1 ATP-binding cassette (ABC) family, regulator of translational elongation [Scheffersomyces stipitis CBS 6054]